MNSNLTLGSLFDGSGGFPLGGLLCGITPVWASEVEPFPIRVTTKRLPFMKHYGDICSISGAEIEPVDIITFGSPCTDMSVAGKRAGLDGKQSVLFYEAIRIIKEMRCVTNGAKPRFIVWENVPGAFSSGKGEDFLAVLTEIIQVKDETAAIPMPEKDKWLYAGEVVGDDYSIAWRTLDAQFWGVPQRRRRIYLVADFAGDSAGEILFESEGMSGYSSQGFGSGQRTAVGAESGFGTPVSFEPGAISRLATGHFWHDSACCLRADMGDNQLAVVIENHPADGRVKIDDSGTIQTLTSRMGTGGNNVPLTLKIRSGCEGGGKGALIQDDKSATLSCNNDQTVFVPKAYGICSDKSNSMLSGNPNSGIYEADTSRTLDQSGGNPSCNQGGIAVVSVQGSMIGREEKNGPQGNGVNKETCYTLNTIDRHAVAYAMTTGSYAECHAEQAATLMARDYKDPQVINTPEYTVRRLTPTECALLQGFPSDWCACLETPDPTEAEITWWAGVFETHRKVMGKTNKPKSRSQIVKWLKNPYSDSAEYRMWGNGVALPNVCFVMAGIANIFDVENA